MGVALSGVGWVDARRFKRNPVSAEPWNFIGEGVALFASLDLCVCVCVCTCTYVCMCMCNVSFCSFRASSY